MRGPFGEVGTRLLIMDVEAVVRGLPRLNSIVLKALGLNVASPKTGLLSITLSSSQDINSSSTKVNFNKVLLAFL